MHESEKSQHSKDFVYQPRGVKGGEEGWTIYSVGRMGCREVDILWVVRLKDGSCLPQGVASPVSGLPRGVASPGSGLPRGVDSMVRLCLLSLVSTGGPF